MGNFGSRGGGGGSERQRHLVVQQPTAAPVVHLAFCLMAVPNKPGLTAVWDGAEYRLNFSHRYVYETEVQGLRYGQGPAFQGCIKIKELQRLREAKEAARAESDPFQVRVT